MLFSQHSSNKPIIYCQHGLLEWYLDISQRFTRLFSYQRLGVQKVSSFTCSLVALYFPEKDSNCGLLYHRGIHHKHNHLHEGASNEEIYWVFPCNWSICRFICVCNGFVPLSLWIRQQHKENFIVQILHYFRKTWTLHFHCSCIGVKVAILHSKNSCRMDLLIYGGLNLN